MTTPLSGRLGHSQGRNRLLFVSNTDPRSRDERSDSDPWAKSSYVIQGTPAPLKVAAALTLLEGLLTVGFGVTEALNIDVDRLVMGATTSLFFLAFGAALVLSAWGLNTSRPWARGPVLLAQLIWLGLAWSFRTGSTLPVAVGLAVLSTVVLIGLLHPRSVEALERAAGRA